MNKVINCIFLLSLTTNTFSKVSFSKTYTSFACEKNKICITGHHLIGSDISLLNLKDQKICTAKVDRNDVYSDEMIYFKRSILKGLSSCLKPLDQYRDAINQKVISLKVIKASKAKASTQLPVNNLNKFLSQTKSVEQWVSGKKSHSRLLTLTR